MSFDFSSVQMSSKASSNKIVAEGAGSFSVAALGGPGETYSVATIPHDYGSDNLIFQVTATIDTAGTGNKSVLPWASNDNRVIQYARLDSSNLYVFCISNSSGGPAPARTVSYYYRLLAP